MNVIKHTPAQFEAVRTAITKSLGEAYDCTRIWSAWSNGTMRPADFRLVAKDDARVDEITMAALNASRVGEVTHVLHAVVSKVVLTTGMREVVDAVLAKAGWRTRGQS